MVFKGLRKSSAFWMPRVMRQFCCFLLGKKNNIKTVRPIFARVSDSMRCLMRCFLFLSCFFVLEVLIRCFVTFFN